MTELKSKKQKKGEFEILKGSDSVITKLLNERNQETDIEVVKMTTITVGSNLINRVLILKNSSDSERLGSDKK